MLITNPIQMNDWKITKFLKVIFIIQFVIWSAIGIDAIGLQIPILRQFIGFIYLSFVPGIIILRILKLHKLGNIETLLYTVGLSIVILIFTGFFMNMIYPFFGISGPISLIPLIITISTIVLILCILCYIRDKEFNDPSYIDASKILSPSVLSLCLIPFLAVLGTCSVNFYHNNIPLMLMVVIIALVTLSISFDRFISKKLYPLAVLIIALSLLYHYSLISVYLTGADIHVEYYFHRLVMINSYWDSSIPGNVNAMLSITILPAVYSHLLNMEGTWVFKVIYPFLFSLVPLGLYHIYQKQVDEKVAFLSVFYFMSVYPFFVEMTALARQQIAEIFLILIILIMISKQDLSKRHILLIVFGIGLILSHYGISYLFLFYGFIGYFFMICILKYKSTIYHQSFLILYIVFTLMWYMFVASGSTFEVVVRIGSHIYNTMFVEILKTQVTSLAFRQSGFITGQVMRVLYLISQFFIFVGFTMVLVKRLVKRKDIRFYEEYIAFSVLCFSVLVVSILTSSVGFNPHRLFHIVSIVLSVFCVIGGTMVFEMLAKVVKMPWINKMGSNSLKVLSVFFVIFFLLNTGFIQEIIKDTPRSIALSQEFYKRSDANDINAFYSTCYPDQDIFSIGWISRNRNKNLEIYADLSHKTLPFISYGMMPDVCVLTNTTTVEDDAYIYLGYPNVHHGLMNGLLRFTDYWNVTDISPFLNEKNILYSNGGSEIYK